MLVKQVFDGVRPSTLTLTMGGFTIGMTEFMMMGVLPDVAASLNIPIPSAGHLISIYALGVVIGAPLMAALAQNMAPRKVLVGLMVICGLFNLLFALSPSYELLLLTRLFAGLPHGAFFGMGAVVASRLAPAGREASTVALMFAGLTIANIIGVPLGTYIGHQFSWRFSFLLIAVVAFLTAISIRQWMPQLKATNSGKFSNSLKAFGKAEPWLILSISAIGTGGLFAWISYIAPLMTEVAGFSASAITPIMIVAGVGMAVGNYMGGKLADRFSPLYTTSCLLIAMVGALVLVALLTPFQVPALIMTFVTGVIAFAVISPMQMLMIQAAKGSEMLASSAIQASSNMGNALGAFLGGLPLAMGYGYQTSQYVGALLAFSGFLIALALVIRTKRSAETQPVEQKMGEVKMLRRLSREKVSD
jgi:DHA1 family arabinose polymer transporter-like MFS transporter